MNINPLLSFLEVQPEYIREKIYEFSDRAKECGYEFPSGKGLKRSFERRQKRQEALKSQTAISNES